MTSTNKNFVRTVLCVDDDPDDRELISYAISEIDSTLHVVHAEDGLNAMEYLSHSKNSVLPSLIIMDINMPKMDGKQTLALLKKDVILSTVPVVVFSTSNSPLDHLYYKQFHVEMVTKPHDMTTMHQDVKRLLQNYVFG